MPTLIVLWGLQGSSTAQIAIPEVSPPHTPIVAQIAFSGIPEDARTRGTISITDGAWLPAGEADTYHIWAAPGSHTITAQGMWVLTRDVQVGDETLPVLVDFGSYRYTAAFTVGEGDDDDDSDPPEPVPDGPWQVMLFYDAATLDDLPEPQRQLLTSRVVRDRLRADGHVLLEVLESAVFRSGVPADYHPWVDAVIGDPLPRIALAPKAGGKVIDFPLPANVELLMALLEDPE